MTANLTPWFPGSEKPTRPGWYEAKCMDGSVYIENWWFDGKAWWSGPGKWKCSFQSRPWRGLAADPAGGAK